MNSHNNHPKTGIAHTHAKNPDPGASIIIAAGAIFIS
tara:strand:- start:727 stop:837 length:111 start_codon:yes stop_codon:yes gene_type:complete